LYCRLRKLLFNNMITHLVRKQIKEMEEIKWGDIPDTTGMRLLWGENQAVIQIYKEALLGEIDKVNLYPSPTKIALKKAIAKYNNVSPYSIVPTNGSDEALELIAKVFIAQGDEVVMPVPSYLCFASVSQMMGAKIISVPLEKDFSLSINNVLKIVTKKTKIIWIANPNNPTGNILMTREQIETLAKKIKCLLVIDECYFELSRITAAQLVKTNPNIIVTRSFSKIFSLAGARLGYIIANEQVTNFLNRLQQTNQIFGINRFAYAAGMAIMSDLTLIENTIIKFDGVKKEFEKKLQSISLQVLPTQTTFCFVKLPKKISGDVFKEKLLKKGIYIKDCSIYPGLGKQFIYLGIPQKRYQQYCVEKMKQVLEEIVC
jgi:histidinol-phosphate aminotransferase